MQSLWLKYATMLFFGQHLRHAVMLEVLAPEEECKQQAELSIPVHEADVRAALQASSYDVRAAALKALIQRSASGKLLLQRLPCCFGLLLVST